MSKFYNLIRVYTPLTALPLSLLLNLLWLTGCNHQSTEAVQPVRPVKVFRVTDHFLSDSTAFAGVVKPRFETALSFRVAGKIIARRIEMGDNVKKGQLLAQLDSNDYRLAAAAVQAQQQAALAERDLSRNDLERYRELLNQQVISPPDLERRETAYIAAEQKLAALTAQLEQAGNQLAYTDLHADRDGVVTALDMESGQVVTAGQTLVKLAELADKDVVFDIPEQLIGQLKLKQSVTVSLWADSQHQNPAVIREIAAAADPATRTYRIKAHLSAKTPTAQYGMTATVWVDKPQSPGLAVPLTAVFSSQDTPQQNKVWLVNETSHQVKSIPVQLAAALADEHIIVTGLQAGQLVVSAGVHRLLEGQTVKLVQTAASLVNELQADDQALKP